MNKVNRFIKSNNVIIAAEILFLLVLQLNYLTKAISNVPLMDYWRYINEIGEKVIHNSLSIKDFWTPSAYVHRNPLLYALLAVNIKFFHYNATIEMYAGSIVLILNACFIYYIIKNKIDSEKSWTILQQILFLPILLAVVNYNQWEIITEQFSLTFMIRIAVFNLIFWEIDRYCNKDKKTFKETTIICLILFCTIILCSQGYFPALVGTILFILIINFILYYHNDKCKYVIRYICIIVSIIIAVGIYMYGLTTSNNGNNFITQFISFIFSGKLIKTDLIMSAAIVLPASYIQRNGIGIYYVVGFFINILVLYSIFLYIKNRIYKKTYYPIMLIVYAGINILLISYARADVFDLNYLASSRYIVESTLMLIGTCWILFYCYVTQEKTNYIMIFRNITIGVVLGIIVLFFINAQLNEMSIAPYRKEYGNNLIKSMLNIDKATDDEINAFQAGNKQYVLNGVQFLKKYNLCYFHNRNWEKENVLIGSNNWSGRYDDGWVEKKCCLNVKTKENGIIIISGYLTDWKNNGEALEIYVNKKYYERYTIENNNFELKLKGKPHYNNIVNIISNFEIVPQNSDKRELSYIISSIQGK